MSGPFGSSQWMYNPSSSFYPYAIDQSLRFEDGDSPFLSRTPSGAGNRKTWTWSAWVKRGNITSEQTLFGAHKGANDYVAIQFDANDTLNVTYKNVGASGGSLSSQTRRKITTQVFRDVSSFYHLVVKFDAANTNCDIYVNGTEVTSFSVNEEPQNLDFEVNSTELHTVGTFQTSVTGVAVTYFDGYMSEVNLIDGTALGPDSFGETKDGIWVAKNISGLTFGTNGFHLDWADSSAIGNDVSGQNNDYTVSGGGSPTLVASDVVLDSPTNNFATMNPLHRGNGTTGSITYSEGNLASSFAGNHTTMQHAATMALPTTGKWYWEQTFTGALTNGSRAAICGIWNDDAQDLGSNNRLTVTSDAVTFYSDDNKIYSSADGSIGNVSYTSSIAEQTGAVVSFAVDMDNTWVWVAVNGTYINGTPDFSDGTNRVDVVTDTNGRYIPFWAGDGGATITWRVNFGQDSANVSSANSDSNGIGTFEYAVPSGYTSLCSANLTEPSIIDGSEYFNTVIYTGDNSQDVTGVGWRPDLVWVKTRDHTYNHQLHDSVRGATAGALFSNSNTAETSFQFDSFDADGFTTDASNVTGINATGDPQVAWNWLAGTAVSGATTGSGTAKTYTGSVNTESGFSIIKYVGNGTSGHTIPHNLTVGGVATTPTIIIVKRLDDGGGWRVQHKDVASTHYLALDTSAGDADLNTIFNDTAFNSTVFTVGSAASINSNDAGSDYIAYCFTDIDQYCKAGSYIGNSNADGTYVHLGFRPAWVMIKETGASGFWMITDNKVYPNNDGNTRSLAANDTGSETTISNRGNEVDFLSNGFKIRASTGDMGASNTHIYLAFAEQPFKYSNAR